MLLRAMTERFHADRDAREKANQELSDTSRRLGLPWWPDASASSFGTLQGLPTDPDLKALWEALRGHVVEADFSASHLDSIAPLRGLLPKYGEAKGSGKNPPDPNVADAILEGIHFTGTGKKEMLDPEDLKLLQDLIGAVIQETEPK